MTKSPRSALKLRLSRLIRCLAALACLKLLIMGAALFDLPMPASQGQDNETALEETAVQETPLVQEHSAVADNELRAPADLEKSKAPAAEEQPQGSEAAELASAARPRKHFSREQPTLPAPLVTAMPSGAISPAPHSYMTHGMPEPPALGAPLAEAGVIIPVSEESKAAREDSIWNMLDLKALPIPGLGSVQAAHAAALDMPVPSAPSRPSPFTPAEQLSPLEGGKSQPIVLPGAPPLPDNLRHGGASSTLPDAPSGSIPDAPAPAIQTRPSALDPHTKAQEIARQQQDILMLRQQMDQRLKDLKSAEDKMQDMIKEASQIEDKKVRSLVQMYANMKPRMAAQALEKMDERVAVRILSGMAPKQSGEILTYTNPSKTAKFTEMMTRVRMGE